MSTIGDIRGYIESTYDAAKIKKTFSEIAKNPKIQSIQECYDFDNIKRQIMGDKCASADALYLKRFIHFIEFKTGFATEKTDANTKTHLENLKLRIKVKAYESLALFEKVILPEIGDGILADSIQKKYIAVIDSLESPMDAYEDILQEASGNTVKNREELKRLYENSLLNYRKSSSNGKYVFYDGIDVWYDFEFDGKIQRVS